MAEEIGFGVDVVTQIINVQWEGLAVIFGEEDQNAPPFEKETT